MKNSINSKYYAKYLFLLNHLSELKEELNSVRTRKEKYSEEFITDLIRSNRLELIKILIK